MANKSRPVGDGKRLALALWATRQRMAIKALVAEGGDCTRAAELLGIHRNTLTRILHDAELDSFEVRRRLRIDQPLPGRTPSRLEEAAR